MPQLAPVLVFINIRLEAKFLSSRSSLTSFHFRTTGRQSMRQAKSSRLLRLRQGSLSDKTGSASDWSWNRKLNGEEISTMYLSGCPKSSFFRNGLLEAVLIDKNVPVTGCRAQSKDFRGYVNSRMGAGDSPCEISAPYLATYASNTI